MDVNTAGVYAVTYSASDTAGNTGTATRTVTVSAPADTTAPVVTLTGAASVTVVVGGTYTEAGATSDGGETVTPSGTVDVNTAGVYTVTYSASDTAGNTGTATRTVTVSAPADTTAPVVTLTGAASVTVVVGGTYTEAGATSDGGETVTPSGTVDVNTAGVYTVTYSASDTAGNTGTATRTVTVSAPADTTAPVVTLTGAASVTVVVGGTYTEAGATSDGGETVTPSGTVDVNTAGVYTVTYSASDTAGNTGTATRTVTVSVPVGTAVPVITLIGAASVTVGVGGAYTEAGATSDGGETVTTSGTVDINTVGVYTIKYSAINAAGNAAVEVVRTVNIVEVAAGENFGKVTTYTNIATTLIGQVTIDGEAAGVGDVVAIYVGEELRGKQGVIINGGYAWLNVQVHSVGGEETAAFKVYDASTGVTHNDIDLSVVIQPEGEVGSFGEPLMIKVVGAGQTDTTAPVIALNGDEVVSVGVGLTYSDAGASASDNVDGDLTALIVLESTVDIESLGSYTVTYNVSDSAGNAAVEVVRAVNVIEADSGGGFYYRGS